MGSSPNMYGRCPLSIFLEIIGESGVIRKLAKTCKSTRRRGPIELKFGIRRFGFGYDVSAKFGSNRRDFYFLAKKVIRG